MSKSIGIDLGTTNSVAAIKRVHTEVLKNAEGDFITPSCVMAKKGNLFTSKTKFVVGKDALEWMKQDPANTIVAVKRLMGRNYNDKDIQDLLSSHKLHYQIGRHSRGTENSLALILNKKEYTPEEISAKILEKIRIDAEKILGDTVEYAVITVPAYFNDKQKHATRTAAVLAGLKVRRLLPEPTAAAISFGVDTIKGDDAKTVLVFDFGGGTFDLSILTISGGQFIEQAKGGDMWLGGEDIDRLIADYVLGEIAREYQLSDIKGLIEKQDKQRKNRFIGEMRVKVEQAKIRLSVEQEAYIEILGLLRDSDGDSIDVNVELTRDTFEKIISPIVDTTVKLTQKILEEIHFTKDLIDNVLMVGGSSCIPSIVKAMKQEFGDKKVIAHERPMLAIAEGAAILSHRLSDVYECPKCGVAVLQSDLACKSCGLDLNSYTIEHGVFDIVHSAAHDYYIHLENNERYLFVEKNTPLPYEKTEVFKLVHPEQKLVHMKFYNKVHDREESIGDLWLGINDEEDNNDSDDVLHAEVTLKIDENNLISVTAALKERPDIRLSKTLSRGKADEKLFVNLEETINDANRKGYNQYVMTDLLHRSLSAIKDIDMVINNETSEVNEKAYDMVALKLEKARKMAEENLSSKPTIYYAQAALKNFGFAISPSTQKLLQLKIKNLEEMDEKGTLEENSKALDDLTDAIRSHLGVVNLFMDIKRAGDICSDTNPSKAPKFYECISNIMQAVMKEDIDKTTSLVQEIMPEVNQILSADETKSATIYKDIRK
ncbi:MAG: Hsp70 family protein [Pseudomonadota bacterium]